MLKFFRKIRQNLLMENKASRYFLYATGEIVLVVIGILIAVSINNWNLNRINSIKQQAYLTGLKNDLALEIKFLEDRGPFYDRIIETGESVISDFSSNGKLSNIADINRKLTSLMFSNNYQRFTTTFNELNSTGQINLIRNDTLRTQVIKYYQITESIQNNFTSNNQEVLYPQIFPIIKSMVIIDQENFGVETKTVSLVDKLQTRFEQNLNHPDKQFELLNAISLRIVIARSDRNSIAGIRNEAEKMLERIITELKADK